MCALGPGGSPGQRFPVRRLGEPAEGETEKEEQIVEKGLPALRGVIVPAPAPAPAAYSSRVPTPRGF